MPSSRVETRQVHHILDNLLHSLQQLPELQPTRLYGSGEHGGGNQADEDDSGEGHSYAGGLNARAQEVEWRGELRPHRWERTPTSWMTSSGRRSVWSQENEEEEEEPLLISPTPWSNAPLDRIPPDPPKWVDDLADELEEKRLEKLGVLAPREET